MKYLVKVNNKYVSSPTTTLTNNINFAAVFSDLEEALEVEDYFTQDDVEIIEYS